MAPRFLVDPDIEFGRQLLQKLDSRQVPVEAALWAYDPDSEEYQFVVASGEVDTCGSRRIYGIIQDVLQNEFPQDQRGRFSDITVTSPSTGVVAALKTAISTPANAIKSIRVTNSVVNREWVDDAYVYRMSITKPSTGSSVSLGNE